MRRRCRRVRALCALLLVCALAACVTNPPADLVLRDVTIYPGEGAPFSGSVIVRGGAIAAVERGSNGQVAAAQVIDGRGKFLIPGLWDMHVHVRASENDGLDLGAFTSHGVTSLRDLGGYVDRLKAAQADGTAGPAIYSSFSTLNGKAFAPFQRAVTAEAELRTAVDDMARAGAVQIKIHRAFPAVLLPAAVRLAHARGLTLTGHIPLGVHPRAACEAGMDGIEHIGSFLEAYISVTAQATADDGIAYMLSDDAEGLYRCLASRRVVVTPTLVVYPAVALQRGQGTMPAGADAFVDAMKRIALRLHRAGVPLLSGTDASDVGGLTIAPGASLLGELDMLQAAGIPARDVIAMATVNASRALGLAARTGAIAPGRAADFVLLDADPGADIGNVRKQVAVYRAGRRVHVTGTPRTHD